VEKTEQLWERFMSMPVDSERVIIVDKGANAAEGEGVRSAQPECRRPRTDRLLL
jgi:hypothetical protein